MLLLASTSPGQQKPLAVTAPAQQPAQQPTIAAPWYGDDDPAELGRVLYTRARADRAAARRATAVTASAVAETARPVQAATRTSRPPAVRKRPVATRPTTPRRGANTTRRPATTRTTAALPAASGSAAVVVAYALAQRGKPYVFGASGPNSFDCSGLILAAFAQVGVRLPHNADAIGRMGTPVPRSQWQPGTVLHWNGHVGLYIGNGLVVHASRAGQPVKIAPVWGSPTGRRII